jgi:beta-RFAP synthase
MSISTGVSKLRGEEDVRPEILASRVSRGERSALGIHGFASGGFLHDFGKLAHEDIGLANRLEFPSDWRFVLVTPPVESGLAGPQEREAFARLPPMPVETTERLQRLLATDMTQALSRRQFISFSEALFEFGRTVGDYFAPEQGGTFASPSMASLIEHLRKRGCLGVGQTSWGPSIFALFESQVEAEKAARELKSDARWENCEFRVTAARNSGANIQILAE